MLRVSLSVRRPKVLLTGFTISSLYESLPALYHARFRACGRQGRVGGMKEIEDSKGRTKLVLPFFIGKRRAEIPS